VATWVLASAHTRDGLSGLNTHLGWRIPITCNGQCPGPQYSRSGAQHLERDARADGGTAGAVVTRIGAEDRPAMRHYSLLLAVLLCGGCATRPDSGLTVFDYNGAAGYGRRIEFDGTALQVVTTSDFEGQEDKRIWRRELTKAERAFLSRRAHRPRHQRRQPVCRRVGGAD